METGKRYLIIYDDKNNYPIKKIGVIISRDGNLFTIETAKGREILNSNYIIRAEVLTWI